MRILEVAHVENPVIRWCKKNKILNRKMNGQGNRSWPDRVFILPNGRVFFIEFKAPKKRLEDLQFDKIKALLNLGQDVEVHDDKDRAIFSIIIRMQNRKVDATPIPERFYPVASKPRGGRPVRRPVAGKNVYHPCRPTRS